MNRDVTKENAPPYRDWCEGYGPDDTLEYYMNYDTHHLTPEQMDNPMKLLGLDRNERPIYEGDMVNSEYGIVPAEAINVDRTYLAHHKF